MKARQSVIPIAGLMSAEFLSLLGNQVAQVAIPIMVLEYTGSELATGVAVAGNAIPYVIAAFIGGQAIDRFGAWPVSIVSDVLSCISVLSLPLVFIMYSGHVSATIIFLLVFAGALFDPTGVSARHTLVPGMARLAGKRLENINTLRGALENAADFFGPVLCIGLIGSVGLNNTLFANAASFLLCAALFAAAVPKKLKRLRRSSGNGILKGARFIFQDYQLRTLAVMGMIAGLVLSSFLGLLLLLLCRQRFGSYALYGISLSAFGISATLGALSFSKLRKLFSYSVIYYGGLMVMGLGIAITGIVAARSGVVLSATLIGIAGAGNPLEQTILQQRAPGAFAGQVFAALPAMRFAAGAIGLVLGGLLTALFPVNMILAAAGSLLICAAIAGWYLVPLINKR